MGPSDSYDAAKAIEQACNDMVDAYVELAEAGEETLNNIKSTIGQLTQYKHTFAFQSGHSGVEYRDEKMGGWERLFISLGGTAVFIEEVPHPERQRAYDELASTQGIVDEVDEKFELDSEDMRDTVGSVAKHMSGWVTTVGQLSELVVPSSMAQIDTPGDPTGWRSPWAMETYAENVKLQDAAHEAAQEVIGTMLQNDATFLENMSTHLSTFADLQRDHEQKYIDMATGSWVPDELSADWVIGKIGEIATFVQDHRNKQTDEAKAMIDILNDAVDSVLDFEGTKRKINNLTEGTGQSGQLGWPMPAQLSAYKTDGTQSFYELEFNTIFFRDHIAFWGDLSDGFGPVISQGESVPDIESMFLQFPAFTATAASGLKELATKVNTDLLTRGRDATKDISEKLDETVRNYLATENLNTEEARKLEELLNE